MTPDAKLYAQLEAASAQRMMDIYNITAMKDVGLMDQMGFDNAMKAIESIFDWNVGQAHMEHDLATGYTRLPAGLEREA